MAASPIQRGRRKKTLLPATEWRNKVAHGATVGFDFVGASPGWGERNVLRDVIFPSLLPELFPLRTLNPQLALWATFARCSAALTGQNHYFFSVIIRN
jgi:hypothetical protein